VKKELKKSHTEVLEWINAHAKHKRTAPGKSSPGRPGRNNARPEQSGFARVISIGLHKATAPKRTDIVNLV